jgi:hypothetical protein
MTEKQREKFYWVGFAISSTIALLAGINLLVNLIYYLVKN